MGVCSFLKALSRETDLLVTLGDIALKNTKIGKGNLHLTKTRFVRYEICCAEDFTCMQNSSQTRTLIKQLWTKISILKEIVPNVTLFTKIVSF